MTDERFDVAIVGAGIVGLAHALAAVRRGLRVVVFDRDAQANGASIRNFGFITVTGQSAGTVWQRALRTRDVWLDVCDKAKIPIVHRNECVIVHSRPALDVLEEFAATEMGAQCSLLTRDQALQRVPMARQDGVMGALWSPLELRIEPRTAIPTLAAYLETLGVTIRRGVHVRAIKDLPAERVIVAPGPDLATLFPNVFAEHNVRLCKLQMFRLAAQQWKLPAAIMSDFALTRYLGFSAQPAAAALRIALEQRDPQMFAYGIHLIVVQSADGSLVVGDTHEYGATVDPFYSTDVERAVLRLAGSVLRIGDTEIVERWIGVYPQSAQTEWLVNAPDARTRIVAVTTGNGMSTAFGLGEEVVAALLD